MALAVSLRFDIIDNKGKTSFTKIRVPSGRTLADYREFAQAVAQLILNSTTGRITRASVCFGIDVSGQGLSTTPSSVSKVSRKAQFRFNTAQTGFYAQMNVPSPSETKVVAGSDDFDQTDADMVSFLADITTGISVTGGTMTFSNGRGHAITSVRSVKEKFRRRKAG